jgi:hypothetical protein
MAKSHLRISPVFIVAVLIAVPSSAARTTATPISTYTTGSFVVTCTSTGELCSPAKKLTFTLKRAGTLTSITYTTPATHCSAIRLHVLRKGHEIATTGVLAAGVQTEHLKTHIALPKGKNTLAFKAQGFVGGCNVGVVGSWGGKVTVRVKL